MNDAPTPTTTIPLKDGDPLTWMCGHGIIEAMRDYDTSKVKGGACLPHVRGPLSRATSERYLLAAG